MGIGCWVSVSLLHFSCFFAKQRSSYFTIKSIQYVDTFKRALFIHTNSSNTNPLILYVIICSLYLSFFKWIWLFSFFNYLALFVLFLSRTYCINGEFSFLARIYKAQNCYTAIVHIIHTFIFEHSRQTQNIMIIITIRTFSHCWLFIVGDK